MTVNAGHRPRKRFGQNFLTNDNVIARIIAAVRPQPGDNLIEIGPGRGALTGQLLAACPNLQVIELDRDLVPRLRERYARYPEFVVHQEDALKTDYGRFAGSGHPLRIVGNLPYNISTPLLFHLLTFSRIIGDMHFMLQKEVVDRLAAEAGTKTYGRLSVMMQYHCRVEKLFNVPPSAFKPAPKVESAVVRLTPLTSPPLEAGNPRLLSQLVAACFQQRRKTLRNTLKHFAPPERLSELDFDLGIRPEKLQVSDFVALSNQLDHLK